ncbi:hypothetical protein HMPREF1565_0991 [Providencia alcalifaciens RIMD 1656011]|uniref:NADH dehydrogenase subunit 1 n=1 Tax=Providencia alcalifaciens 205/92 TaxID=1256988 RepID=A0AAV3M781_9GAMM|nr:hypothetical protein HMPREF1565_0991 [Providencia alcalifaciens RIMD 1656011]EUD11663.1 hypothetical protein HMPREF1563_0343 [Providencia alcalifaciens 205/92]
MVVYYNILFICTLFFMIVFGGPFVGYVLIGRSPQLEASKN